MRSLSKEGSKEKLEGQSQRRNITHRHIYIDGGLGTSSSSSTSSPKPSAAATKEQRSFRDGGSPRGPQNRLSQYRLDLLCLLVHPSPSVRLSHLLSFFSTSLYLSPPSKRGLFCSSGEFEAVATAAKLATTMEACKLHFFTNKSLGYPYSQKT